MCGVKRGWQWTTLYRTRVPTSNGQAGECRTSKCGPDYDRVQRSPKMGCRETRHINQCGPAKGLKVLRQTRPRGLDRKWSEKRECLECVAEGEGAPEVLFDQFRGRGQNIGLQMRYIPFIDHRSADGTAKHRRPTFIRMRRTANVTTPRIIGSDLEQI